MQRTLPDGHRVRYRHIRRQQILHADRLSSVSLIDAKGGTTEAFVYDAENQLVSEGTAACRPDENFNKALGRAVSLGRALFALERRDEAIRLREAGRSYLEIAGRLRLQSAEAAERLINGPSGPAQVH